MPAVRLVGAGHGASNCEHEVLLRKATAFVWTPECKIEFVQMKAVLADERLLKAFNPNLYTKLLVDTSKVAGADYILIQRTKAGMVHIIRRQWPRLRRRQQVLAELSITVLTT